MENKNIICYADLHNHLTTSSRIPKGTFNQVADLASERLGKFGIVGIVNFSDWRWENLIGQSGYEREYLGKKKNAVYIPEKEIFFVKGQEIPTREGHLLVLGTEAGLHLKEGRTLEDSIKEAKDNGGIIIADHPFYKQGIGEYLEKHPQLFWDLAAMETHSGASVWIPGITPANANSHSVECYDDHKLTLPNLGALSSSDGHSLSEIGSSYTQLSGIEKDNFVPSLKKAIQNTNLLRTSRLNSNSYFGALNHGAKMLLLNNIAYPLGFRNYFLGTDRPEN